MFAIFYALGITLYEQYNQIIRLAQMDFDSKTIKRKQYLVIRIIL